MKWKRFASGLLAAVMSFSLMTGQGGFVLPAYAAQPEAVSDGAPDPSEGTTSVTPADPGEDPAAAPEDPGEDPAAAPEEPDEDPSTAPAEPDTQEGEPDGMVPEAEPDQDAEQEMDGNGEAAQDLPPLDLSVSSGLILYSTFDEADRDGTAVKDLSGNNHNGTAVGSLEFVDVPGGGQAVKITGQKDPGEDNIVGDRYVDYGASAGIIPETGDFSVSLWYQALVDAPKSNVALLCSKAYTNGANKGFVLGYVNTPQFRTNVGFGGGVRKEVVLDKEATNQLTDQNWHHFVSTVDRDGNITFYVDAQAVGSTSVADTTTSIEAGLHLVLGAGGDFKNAANDCCLDDLAIYDRVVTAQEIRQLYEETGPDFTLQELERMKAELLALETGLVYPAEEREALLEQIDEMIAGVKAGTIDRTALANLKKAYQTFFNGATPLASFHMISDVHVDGESQTAVNAANYITAMENMKTLNPGTTIAFVNAGDNTQSGQSAQYKGFYDATAAHDPVSAAQTLILLGNHDVRGEAGENQKNWNRDPNYPEKCVYWETAKGLYLANNAPYMPTGWDGETLYHSKTLGGYTFLMLNTELGLKDAMYMSDAQLAWFEAEMKKAYEADPNKPVFIVSHQALNETHWLSNLLDGFDGVKADGSGQPYQTGKDAKVKEIMEKYPVGIFLSGHIHNGFGQASVIPRSYGVNVDIPSLNDSLSGVKDKGTGYEVMIYDGYVAFRARNFVTEQWLPEYDVVVPTGGHSYPRLIQRLEPVMSDLRYYSEADAAKLEEAFGGFWDLIDRYYDQSAAKWDSVVPTDGVLKFTPDELTEISDAADAAWNKIQVLDQVTRLDTPRKTVYDILRENWRAYLLGGAGDDLDLDDAAVSTYVKNLNRESGGYWNSLVKGGTYSGYVFPDLDMTDNVSNATTRSGNMGTTLQRLSKLSMAWATKGCTLYHNDYVLEEIIKATDYVVNNYFQKGKYTNRGAYGNWYHWEITCPTALGNIAMVLYDELGADRVELYAQTIQYYAPGCDVQGPNSAGPVMTGGNLLLKANGVAQAGILLEDASMLENVRAGVKRTVSVYNDPDNLFSCGNPGDGFYADGSYIQHQALPYIAGYGADLYNNFSIFGRMFKDTPWEISYEANEEPLIYDFVFDGIEPFITGTRTMDMVASRDITRNGHTDRTRTASILNALLGMRGTFPTAEQNRRFDGMMKYYLSQDPDYYYSRMSSISAIQTANELMADDSVTPRPGYSLTKTFAMDRTVHHTEGFTLGIAMQSTRTFAHEIINNEGKRTWNIANGMVFLYDGDEDQYGGNYWATVDPTRLPGTTAEHVVLANGCGSLNANIYDWTGGSSIGSSGVAGMYMKALSRSDDPKSYAAGPRTGADMKKSWFLFGDRVLALGSSITSNTGDRVETTVENRKIKPNGTNVVTVDGSAAELSTNPAAPTALENPIWMHLEGNVPGADIGYYFPEDITLQAMKDTRTGNWADQGTTTGTATDTYATFYVDHGANPTDAGYAYVLLPGRSAAETAAYAEDPDIEILKNDGAIHAARDNSQNILAANFWQAGSLEYITVSAPASVIVQRDGDRLTVGVSDPTQRDVPITVTLAMTGELVDKDDAVTLDDSSPLLRFTVDTTEGLGGTYTATFRVEETTAVELMGVAGDLAPVEAQPGTAFYDLALPKTAVFSASDGKEYTLDLVWSRGDYDADAYGSFTVTAEPVLTGNLRNSAHVGIELTVKTAGYEVLATGDTYVNDGNNADRNYNTAGTLAVKLDSTSYQREALFRFDISNVPDGAEQYLFRVAAGMDDLFQGGALYVLADNWDPATVTWNTKPAQTGDAVATFTKDDLKNGLLSLDITALIRALKEQGKDELSLAVAATGTKDSKNQMSISSLESSASQKPAILSIKEGGTAIHATGILVKTADGTQVNGDTILKVYTNDDHTGHTHNHSLTLTAQVQPDNADQTVNWIRETVEGKVALSRNGSQLTITAIHDKAETNVGTVTLFIIAAADPAIRQTIKVQVFRMLENDVSISIHGVNDPNAAPKYGDTLEADINQLKMTDAGKAALRYQWKRNGSAISGATGKTYILMAEDMGATISVDVTADPATCYEGTRSATRSQAVVKADRAAITANIHGEKAAATDNSDGRIVGFPTDDGMIYEYKLAGAADTAENWHTVSGAQVTVAASDYVVRIQATATHNASAARNVKVGTYNSTMNLVRLDENMRNGFVIRDRPQANKGDTVTLTINPATGYELENINVTRDSGGQVTLSGTGSTRTFPMPDEAVTVFATFKKRVLTITHELNHLTCSLNGAGDSHEVEYGTTAAITLVPDEGYTLPARNTIEITNADGVKITGWTIDDKGKITITGGVTSNLKIKATGIVKTYVVNYTLTDGLSAPQENAPRQVAHGAGYAGKLVAESGYTLPGSITVTMGGEAFTDNEYTYENGTLTIAEGKITGNLVITASGVRAVDITALKAAITAANAAKEGVVVGTTAADVAKDTRFITQAEMDALIAAITTAQAVADRADAAQDEVDAAETTLNDAVKTFKAAIKTGSYTPSVPSGGNTPSNPSTTTKVEKNPDGSTTTTVTDKKTGTVTATTEKADGSREIVETRKDGTVTETIEKTDGTRQIVETKKDGTVTQTVEKTDGSREIVETKKDGTVTATTEKTDGSKEVVETKKDGTVTETKTDAGGGEARKITDPEKNTEIKVTDPTGEVLVEVKLPAEVPAPEKRFEDVPEGHWADEAIHEMAGLGVVSGVGGNQFDMNSGIKRGDLALLLSRMSNAGQKSYDMKFTDVPAGKYYAGGVAWAAKTGIVTGRSEDKFDPEATITRGELAVMLYRYAKLLKLDTSANRNELDSFTDGGQTPDWAEDALAWCVKCGIIRGRGDNTLDPRSNITRAEVAVMLQRFIDLTK